MHDEFDYVTLIVAMAARGGANVRPHSLVRTEILPFRYKLSATKLQKALTKQNDIFTRALTTLTFKYI